jgi:hypothetical protein
MRRGAASLAELGQMIKEDLGVAEFFAIEGALVAPAWVNGPGRFVEPWWFVTSRQAFHAYVLANTPAVLARHGVFMAREVFDRV